MSRARRLFPYLFCGILLLAYRLWVNFSHELLPGINGGYYPLQIRSVMENGSPGFSDMPLLFYLNAFLVRAFSLFCDQDTGQIILFTSRLTDSLSLPLLLIPLYQIRKDLAGGALSPYSEWLVVSFASLSMFPLMLVSEAQKNAMAIPMMGFFLLCFLRFLRVPSFRSALAPGLFLILTGLTHFGVFSVALSLLLIGILVFFRKRSLIFILPIAAMGLGLVRIFDPERADSVLWLAFTLFRGHIFAGGPVHLPVILYLVSGLIFIVTSIYLLYHKRCRLPDFVQKTLLTLLTGTFILSFPLTGEEYLLRFSLIMFFPQAILLMLLFTYLKGPSLRVLQISISAMVILSLTTSLAERKSPVLSAEAVEDLYELKGRISDTGNVLVIARHGLEWWAGWILETSIGQERSLDEETFRKYDKVIILVQKKVPETGRMTHHRFPEPGYPPDAVPLYESEHILAVELGKEQFLNRPPETSRPPVEIIFSRQRPRHP